MNDFAEGSEQIPDCELIELIGKGGAGTVYRGKQRWLDRTVAIKTLRNDEENTIFDSIRFNREAKLLASLNHPSIVGCYQAGVTNDDIAYIVMEYVSGPTLKDYVINNGPLSESRTVTVLTTLAQALHYANQHGVIHRDIKPENVLLEQDPDGDTHFPWQCKLADLGLARDQRVTRVEEDITQAGTIVGSPRFMAPEQFDNPAGVDHRADIYALGCLGVFLLTGKNAFNGEAFTDLLHQKLVSGTPNGLLQITHPGLRDLLDVMMKKDSDQRPQDYPSLLDKLGTCHDLKSTIRHNKSQQSLLRPLTISIFAVATIGVILLLIIVNTPPDAADPINENNDNAVAQAVANNNLSSSNSDTSNIQAPTVDKPVDIITAVPLGDLLENLQTGLKNWNHLGAKHAPAENRQALILASGSISHLLPPPPFELELNLSSESHLPVGSTQITLGSESTDTLTISAQNLGDSWLWSVTSNEQTIYSDLVAQQLPWQLRIVASASACSIELQQQEIVTQTGPQSWAHFSIAHQAADGSPGALAIEAVVLTAFE